MRNLLHECRRVAGLTRQGASTYDRPMILRCTKKLLDVIRPEQLAVTIPDESDWYANLLFFDDRKNAFS